MADIADTPDDLHRRPIDRHRTIDAQSSEISGLKRENDFQKSRIDAEAAEIARLTARVAELEAALKSVSDVDRHPAELIGLARRALAQGEQP